MTGPTPSAPAPPTTQPLCFAIGPYGSDGSHARKWSNFLFEKVIEPVLKETYRVQRTIDDPEPGRINDRIERDLRDARIVVADLTDANPNVYFELGYRYALGRPLVHIARAGTVLPFDIRDVNVIWVDADYFEPRGFFVIADDKLQEARVALRRHLDKVANGPIGPAVEPVAPISAKVYRWQMWYSSQIAIDWLERQGESFREAVARYEGGGGIDSFTDASLPLFAEYLALKGAAAQTGDGTIFLTVNNYTNRLDLGYAVFRFASSPDPVLINVVDVKFAGPRLSAIKFAQPSRPYPIERGGRLVNVMIPGYNYTLAVTLDTSVDDTATGIIEHPHSRTPIGQAEVTSRYGDVL